MRRIFNRIRGKNALRCERRPEINILRLTVTSHRLGSPEIPQHHSGHVGLLTRRVVTPRIQDDVSRKGLESRRTDANLSQGTRRCRLYHVQGFLDGRLRKNSALKGEGITLREGIIG